MKPLVQPIGIGDLLVVKQNVLGYRTAELAEARNIMAGELHEASTRSLRRQEIERLSRFEREEEDLRESEVTERFELAQETRKTILSETSFEAGAEVSAGFGPVQASAFFGLSITNSETESTLNATKYAREVVERSLKRIMEKTLEERRETLIEEFEEKALHRFGNEDGQNRSGLYFWLEKLVRLKVINYGKRVYYKFYVSEPGALYVMSRTRQQEKDLPEEPTFPTVNGVELTPSKITRSRWRGLAAQVRASGVRPPPPRHRYVTKHVVRESRELISHFTISPSQVEIPKGYFAEKIDGTGIWWWNRSTGEIEEPRFDLDLIVGKTHRSESEGEDTSVTPNAVEGDVGAVPIGVQYDTNSDNFGTHSIYAAVRIKCRLEKAAFQKWQMETYDAIVTAYNNLRSDYEERVAQAAVSGGFQVAGQHPDINRSIERRELRKGCITVWTGFAYDHARGIDHDPDANPPDNYPEINLENAAALAKDVELMEEGPDWDNMTYRFMPYYWARKRKWFDILGYEDPDPLFQSFLQAGAAIVLVPIKPEYTRRILYFQLNGTHAPDDDVPDFHTGGIDETFTIDPTEDNRDEEFALYHSFVQEIEAQPPFENLDADIEISADDPDAWQVSIPLPLVYLAETGNLPEPADA